jgi:hypothetical protein
MKLIKIFTLTIFFSFSLLGLTLPANAQPQQPKIIDVEISRSIQNPADKSFWIFAQIKSDISTQRADIEWYLPPSLEPKDKQFEVTEGKITQNINIATKQDNRYGIEVKPTAEGEFEIKVVVIVYQSDSRYLTTARTLVTIQDNLAIHPIDVHYSKLYLYFSLFDSGLKLTIVLFVLFIVAWAIKKIYFKIKPFEDKRNKTGTDSNILIELEKIKHQSLPTK